MYKVFKRTQLRKHFYNRTEVLDKVARLRATDDPNKEVRYEVDSHCGLYEDELIYTLYRVNLQGTWAVYSDVLRYLRRHDDMASNEEYFVEVVCK